MDHSFVVSLTRFHRTDPNRYVLQGYFEQNTPGNDRITACLDGRELPVQIGVREGLGIRQKYFSRGIGYENIDREYDIWITLPENWEAGKILKVYQSSGDDGRRICIYRTGTARLKKERRMPDGYLETFRMEDGKVYIGGWAVGNGTCRFKVTDANGESLPGRVTWHYRQDIVDSYPEALETEQKIRQKDQAKRKTSPAPTDRNEGMAPTQEGNAEGPNFGYELAFVRPKTDRITLTVATRSQRMSYRLNLNKGLGKGALKLSPWKKTTAYFKRYGLARTVRRVGQKIHEGFTGQREGYMAWRTHVIPSGEELKEQREAVFERRPLISIVVPLYRTDEKLLGALVDSVKAQTYTNWELCLSDGSGSPSPLADYLRSLTAGDPRIRVIDSGQSLGISENTNQALSIAAGDYIAFADHDDLLPPWALYEVAREVNEHPETLMIYSDEDKVTMNGRTYFQPHFKSDFNIDLLRSMNYFCHLVVVSAQLLERVKLPDEYTEESKESGTENGEKSETDPSCRGEDAACREKERQDRWFDPAFDGAQDYDFVLRCVECALQMSEEGRETTEAEVTEKTGGFEEVGEAGKTERTIRHIPKVLYHWRSHPSSTSENPESKRYAFEAGMRAVQAHLDRIGVKAQVSMGAYPGLYRVRYAIPEPEPLVSIIIPNKDHADDLRRCVESIVERSAYRNFEFVVVENGSQTKEIFDYYRACEEKWDNFRVVTWTEGFNYSAINNFGVRSAKGDLLLFLNNDTEMTDPDLITELAGPCLRREVGAVGARLFYEDGTIQHAGVIIGYGGIAGHAFQGMGGDENGYFSRIICQSDLSAVTAACMMVSRDAFKAAGGFDPVLAVAFNDIDFCLRLRKMGYLVVYNPFAVMQHYESRSRGMEDTAGKIARFNKEADVLLGRWGGLLKEGDPYYNPNLSLDRVDFGLKKY